MIPKIIHQTAPTKKITWEEKTLLKRNKKILSDYEFKFYDDNDCRALMKQYFPQYYDAYNHISRGVCKADIARLVFMYAFGGWYCDTDYKWITPPI